MNICQECRGCCKFSKDDEYFSPVFTKKEIENAKINRKMFKQKSKNVFQINLIKSKLGNYLVCPFLDEETHLCKIYANRPMDCKLWPIIFMFDKNGKDIFLACFDKSFCKILENMSEDEFIEYKKNVMEFIKSNKLIYQLKEHKELIWNYEKDTFLIAKINLSDSSLQTI
ncbi:MAG: YkgJ family cysteine cluster protein [Candidatus Aenigmatarchaeota archaeon]|nr:YkgJ family cysteine cluster protein [Candidatus Aenigmarchaeota archaeon]